MPNNIIMADASGYKAGDWLDAAKPEGEVIYLGTSPVNDGLRNRTNVTSVIMPNATSIPDNMLYSCPAEKLIADEVADVGAAACQGCKCSTFVFPKLKVMYTFSFADCKQLKAVDFGGTPSASQGFIRNSVFSGDTVFDTLVLRANTVWTLSNIGTFSNTPFASGKSGGTLYVPQAMIPEYQAANNWSTILGYPNNRIMAIEGSPYEHYYVDGRPIPTGG